MDPNQAKNQDRSAAGNKPREQDKQREEKPTMPGPGERRDPNKGKEDPSGIPENNQPYDDKTRPAGHKGSAQPGRPQPDDESPRDTGVDTLKPGR